MRSQNYISARIAGCFIEVNNIADIANKRLRDESRVHGSIHSPKITSNMVWQIIKAMEVETPICRNCESQQKMIFQDCGERSIYYCPNCQTEIDFEFWVNGMYTKDVTRCGGNHENNDRKY